MKHLVNWIEIPVTNWERAKNFYQVTLGIKFQELEAQGMQYALFPSQDSFNCGALVRGEHYKPSRDGITIYLDGGHDMDTILKHVEEAGGEIIMSKTYTGEMAGHIGIFIDSEGNKIGLQHI